MSSDEEEEEHETLDAAKLKALRPEWRALAMALDGRYALLTEDDVWQALEKFGGHLAKASLHLKALSDERSISPEDRAIRDLLVSERASEASRIVMWCCNTLCCLSS